MSIKLENAAFQYAFHLSMSQELVNVANTLRIFTECSETDSLQGGIPGRPSNFTSDCVPLISMAASVDYLKNGNAVVDIWHNGSTIGPFAKPSSKMTALGIFGSMPMPMHGKPWRYVSERKATLCHVLKSSMSLMC